VGPVQRFNSILFYVQIPRKSNSADQEKGTGKGGIRLRGRGVRAGIKANMRWIRLVEEKKSGRKRLQQVEGSQAKERGSAAV